MSACETKRIQFTSLNSTLMISSISWLERGIVLAFSVSLSLWQDASQNRYHYNIEGNQRLITPPILSIYNIEGNQCLTTPPIISIYHIEGNQCLITTPILSIYNIEGNQRLITPPIYSSFIISRVTNVCYYMIELCLVSNWLKSTWKVMRTCDVNLKWAKISS